MKIHRSWARAITACLAALPMLGARAQPADGAAAAGAPNHAPIAAEQFFARPAVLDAKLSPSGRRLAISTSYQADRVGLVVIDLQDQLKASRIARFKDADVVRFDWTSDERLVFSVRDLETGSGEDRYIAPGLYAVNADGSEPVQLVRRTGQPFIRDASMRSPALDWNHVLLHVPQQQDGVTPNEIILGRYDISGREIESITPLWINTKTGRTRRVSMGGAPDGAMNWWFDSQGRPRALLARGKGRQSVWWRDPFDGPWRQLVEGDALSLPMGVHSVDDDGTLYVTRSEGPQQYRVLSTFDFERLRPAQDPLVRTPGFDFSGGLLRERAGVAPLGVRVVTDAESTVWFDPEMKRLQQEIDARFPANINRLSCRRCGQPDMTVLVRSFSDRDPGQLWLYETGPKRWTSVAQVLSGIDPQRMASVAFERITARDGRELPVWLTLPQGMVKGQPRPAVVLVHGGPWLRGGHWRWQPMEQFLASRGYVVISPEFRGSTGYGQAHYRAGWKQYGKAMQDDVADALLWAQKQGYADSRACIAGASYGGYSTLMGLARDGELYRCGVAWVALTDLPLYVQGSWWISDDISSEGRRFRLPELVGDPVKDADLLREQSPVTQAARIKAPLLLGYGEADLRIPLAHGKRMREALIEAGNPPEWVSYPDEGHSWRRVETMTDFARRMEAFLARHLGKTQP
jgi:acetyl esterase/lipase